VLLCCLGLLPREHSRFPPRTFSAEALTFGHVDNADLKEIRLGPTRALGMEMPLEVVLVLAVNQNHASIVVPKNRLSKGHFSSNSLFRHRVPFNQSIASRIS
jgi:hypothetical protein